MNTIEGYMPFRSLKTYYRVVGECAPGKSPLLLLHGGPGSSHNYFEVLDELAEDGRAIISYDQIGCGRSPAPGRRDLFNREVWVEELIALREHLQQQGIPMDRLHILGQSWGGMLLLEYVCCYKPEGLKSLILASTLPDAKLWSREQHRMIRELPPEMQEAIAEADRTGDYSGENYEKANAEYMRRHCAPHWTKADPECLRRPKGSGAEAYLTAWGPNEYTPLGNLRDFDHTEELADIRIPTLITSGTNDLCTPLIAKTMHDRIPDSRWELFADSRHMAFAEEHDKYVGLLREWLNAQDGAFRN